MFRCRRRFAMLGSLGCTLVFLLLYFVISNISNDDEETKPKFGAIELKLQQLENGLKRHGDEMYQLKNRLDNTIQQKSLKKPERKKLKRKHTPGIESGEECPDLKLPPSIDIQMLDMYRNMSFVDIDGGAWKQGWNIRYNPSRYNANSKLKVFVVPHSHNDPGWIKTFEDYYEHDTKHILSNALRHLRENPEMKFIWAEISFFCRFYEDLGQQHKQDMKRLVKNGQLEFVTGGWVMSDEANSHWFSILLQLTEGQTWLKRNFNVTPISSWAIDPFGHSPTLPYILKKSGFENLLIQRTHYSVKKELAQKKQLEFHWRQLWDDMGTTDIFTHMMPFYSYDIPHTCGPDPKICCQFDFKRMPNFGLSCPWHVPPQAITDHNVAARAAMIVDQWKKKSELYRTKSLLIPLGDDFRFSQSTEWDVQRVNYQALFDHINNDPSYAVEAKFGTLQEYFDSVRSEKEHEFPVLSGDFFTYADRSDNYWSGYYTTRPFHKRMDRLLLHYIRSAEILTSWHNWDEESNIYNMLEVARRDLSLFQHHDGITGTSKVHVVEDYQRRLINAIKNCKFAMQHAVYRLLTKSSIYNPDYKFSYFLLDESHWPGPDDSRTTIILGEELPNKIVVFHNSLPQWREELVDFYVSSPFMNVYSFDKNHINAQVNPVWTWHRDTISNTVTPQASTTKYQLIFKIKVPPLGLSTYIIQIDTTETKNKYTSFATNLILTKHPMSTNLGEYPLEVNFGEHRETSLCVGDGPTVAFTAHGQLKSIQIEPESPHMPVHLKFLKYITRISGDRSGAYLFLPQGVATPLVNMEMPVVLITEGQLESTVTVGLPFVVHQTVLRGGPPEIRNLVDITKFSDTEIAMRLSTHIKNGETFYTDLNNLQIIKRQRFNKIPLQANFYPVPGAIFIEDSSSRLTLVNAQPLGGTSLAEGELEVILDRRLSNDDERGLGEGVHDNKPVLHIFRIVYEKLESCHRDIDIYPGGSLTHTAYRASKSILNPIDKFIFTENKWLGVQRNFGARHLPLEDDLEIVAMRTISNTNSLANDRKGHNILTTGIIVHRTILMDCIRNEQYGGMVNLKRLLEFGNNKLITINSTTLTFLQNLKKLDNDIDVILMCPMDTRAFIIQQRYS